MKPNEVREMADDALFERAAQIRESLFRLRFKLALGNTDTVRQLRAERKDLARIKTELRTREVEREREAGTRSVRRNLTRSERKTKTARRLAGQKAAS